VAVLHSGRTCQIQGTQQKTSHAQIPSSLTTLRLLLLVWYFGKMLSNCWCAAGVQLSLGEMTGRLLDTKSVFGRADYTPNPIDCRAPGHLGFYQFLSLLPAHQSTAGQEAQGWRGTWPDIFQPFRPCFVHCAGSSGVGLYVVK